MLTKRQADRRNSARAVQNGDYELHVLARIAGGLCGERKYETIGT